MWIVRLALRRPYTVAIMALPMLYMGVLSMTRMVVDIFPAIPLSDDVSIGWLTAACFIGKASNDRNNRTNSIPKFAEFRIVILAATTPFFGCE
jgi:hypothetical protein